MGKLSQRMRELNSKADRGPDKRPAGTAQAPPSLDEVGWVMSAAPAAAPQSRRHRDLFLLGLAVIVIILMNLIFWETGGDLPVIDPGTGRQVNPSEPWN
jgi:hypothetical protein